MFAIAAMSKNRVIGNGDAIPWRIPDEFRWFRRMTLGGVVVMGRRTFESLPRPLDGRVNVVLTRDPGALVADAAFRARYGDAVIGAAAHGASDLAQLTLPGFPQAQVRVATGIELLARAGIAERAWLCGGAQVYGQFLGECSELYLSVVDREVEGDTLFPPFEHLFDLAAVAAEFPDFRVLRYVRNGVSAGSGPRKPRGRADAPDANPSGVAST